MTEWKPVCNLSLLLISHQGEHWLEPGASGDPWGQLPHQPLLQGTRQHFWSRDHPCVPEDACAQEKTQLLPHDQLLSGVWAYHHSLYMCYLQAQLNRTKCSNVNLGPWWKTRKYVCSDAARGKDGGFWEIVNFTHCYCFPVSDTGCLAPFHTWLLIAYQFYINWYNYCVHMEHFGNLVVTTLIPVLIVVHSV